MHENEMQIRFNLNKMQYNMHEDLGIYFLKNDSPMSVPHRHDCYEIEYIFSGELKETINDNTYDASSGDIVLLTPEDFHKITKVSENVVLYTVMFPERVIDDDLLSKLETRFKDKNLFVGLDDDEKQKIESLLGIIEKELKEQKTGYKTVVLNLLNVIIATVLRESFSENTIKEKHPAIKKAVSFIKNNFEKNITLLDVAKEVNLEANYFSLQFKKSMGVSFKAFLNETRLNYAAKELEYSNKSITEICYLSGYGSLSNFNRNFKNYFGVTPRRYRRDK